MKRSLAEDIERQISLPDHERPLGDETTLALEAKLLRQRADELALDAQGIEERMHQPLSEELTREVEEWATDVRRSANTAIASANAALMLQKHLFSDRRSPIVT